LTQDDRLLVPRYLAEKPADLRLEEFCTIRYSRMIRRVGSPATKVRLGGKGVVTMVLPDHVGSCKSFEDRFPADAHFLLASDGFYEGFSQPHEMWHWLVSHESALRDRQQRGVLLQQLHQQLQTTRGDDDISFIWLKTHGSSMNKEQINAG
jgi:serine/threonine protein phosphatase PrpC